MYLLDTDTYSNLLHRNPRIVRRVFESPPASVYLSVITPEEMLRGRLATINQARAREEPRLSLAYDFLMDLVRDLNRFTVLRYDIDGIEIFGGFPASIKRAGSQDCRIAAVANANGFTVITSNTAHFAKIGVACEDWNLSDET